MVKKFATRKKKKKNCNYIYTYIKEEEKRNFTLLKGKVEKTWLKRKGIWQKKKSDKIKSEKKKCLDKR